ncbi:hypothetical protein PO124_28615 [Bacillus licheniformis]|nr:hypothetical protein [Bacillus licheniformis]
MRLQAELTRRGARRAAADVDLFKILTMRDDGTGRSMPVSPGLNLSISENFVESRR